jgi:uncharacterized protein YjbJ (UPF0337 family)
LPGATILTLAPASMNAVLVRLMHWSGRRHEIQLLGAATCILRKREIPMGEIVDKIKGKAKQIAGTVAGNDKLKADGEVDELKGNAKGAVEDIKRAAKGAAK